MNISRASRTSVAIAALAMALLTVTIAQSNPATDRAAAAFVNRTEMRHWLADGERGLWIQAANLKWFDTRASGNINRTSSVVAPGRGRCRVHTFAPSGGPPEHRSADVVPQPQAR